MPGTAASALYMIASLLRSSADVASSRIASLGLLTSTRAKASRCCSPNESSSPQSRTASSPSTPRSAKRSSCTVARASSKLPSVPRLLPLAHSSTVLGYTSCWRSEPSVQYGRCGRNIVSAVCGREMSPEPRSHSPATARSIDDLPVPELPIRRRWRPGCTSTDTFEKRRREPTPRAISHSLGRLADKPPGRRGGAVGRRERELADGQHAPARDKPPFGVADAPARRRDDALQQRLTLPPPRRRRGRASATIQDPLPDGGRLAPLRSGLRRGVRLRAPAAEPQRVPEGGGASARLGRSRCFGQPESGWRGGV
mmetsp:Transcript_5740/g.18489  ORF Transcript_5740/g.18489 Transcript_5740/m.18489 type:complete len:312 (+) Transcript_5740:386-1321(+)